MRGPLFPNLAEKDVNLETLLPAMHDQISLALESARQITFDWHFLDDQLYFSTSAGGELKNIPFDTTRGWRSEALASLIHVDDLQMLRDCLRKSLRETATQDDGFHNVELRLKDPKLQWRWVAISSRIVERDQLGRPARIVGTFTDINECKRVERKRMEAELVDSEKLESAILTAALDCIVSINYCGEIISFNEAAELTFGYRSEDVIGKKLADIIIPEAWHELHRLGIERFLMTGQSSILNKRMELTAMRADGSSFPVELAIVPLSVQNRPIFTAFIRDISERKRAETLQLGQNRILNMVATGAPLPEILSEITRFAEQQSGRGLCSILQLNDEENAFVDCIGPNLPPDCLTQLSEITVGPRNCSCGAAVYHAKAVTVTDIASNPLWMAQRDFALQHGLKACTSWPIFARNKKILGTFALYFREAIAPTTNELQLLEVCTNLAGIAIESRASEEKIRYLAHYDGLTSLPNRFLFREHLELALSNARRHGTQFAVFFLDLDKFKEINDTFGHDAGDRVLRETAKRLRACLRHTDKIARMGGDEFYVLIEDLNDGRYAADVAQKLLHEASRPVRIGDHECRLSVSIGISVYPDDGCDGQMLLKNADCAMYRAKNMGKNGYQFYSCIKGQAGSSMAGIGHHLRARHAEPDVMRMS